MERIREYSKSGYTQRSLYRKREKIEGFFNSAHTYDYEKESKKITHKFAMNLQ
jgi:hypothetical protein